MKPLRHPGTEIRLKRLARGESLRHLADRLGITPAYLSDIETAKRNLSFPMARKLSQVLGTHAYSFAKQQFEWDWATFEASAS